MTINFITENNIAEEICMFNMYNLQYMPNE